MTSREFAIKIDEIRQNYNFYVGLHMFRAEGNLYELDWIITSDNNGKISCSYYYIDPQLDRYECQDGEICDSDEPIITFDEESGWYILKIKNNREEYVKVLEFIILPKKSIKFDL